MDDTTNPPQLEVTWTPATCDGLPPVGSKVAVRWPDTDDDKYRRWRPATIRDYLTPNHPFRPVEVNGNDPWIYVSIDGVIGYNRYAALSEAPLLGIEKQPEGWPDIKPEPDYPNLDLIRRKYDMTEAAFADLLKAWLKDNGYLKR